MIAFLRSAPSPLFSRRGLDLDFPMLAGCLALLGLGLVMITSASSEVAAVNADNPMYYMIRHLIYVLLGIGAAALVLLVPLSVWQRLDWMLLIAAFVLLILVLIPGIGREVNGSMRWIGFGRRLTSRPLWRRGARPLGVSPRSRGNGAPPGPLPPDA